jgi:hypothetical protein
MALNGVNAKQKLPVLCKAKISGFSICQASL